jgi:predicted Zn-dependent peptidase
MVSCPRQSRWSVLILLGLAACAPRRGPSPPPATPSTAPAPTADGPSIEAILAASDLPEVRSVPLADDRLGVTVHRLANGMTVIISTNREEPRFRAWIAVRAGSRHDPADSTGLAHYLEHMLFKGTDELGTLDYAAETPHLKRIAEFYGALRQAQGAAARDEIVRAIDTETQKAAAFAIPNEIDKTYAALGATGLNAFTWHEMTVYIADVPSNRLQAWAALEGERFRDPVFRLFYPELEAVYEEKNSSLDRIEDRLDEANMAALFPQHPYGTQPTIGLVSHLKTPAYADMEAFFERWYAPNNMAIVLAGDIDAATALPVLEKAFSELVPRPLPEVNRGAPALTERKEIAVQGEGENALTLSWRTVGYDHDDVPALDIMGQLMSGGGAGLLDRELVLTQKVPRALTGGELLIEGGYWSVSATARAGQSHAELEELLLGVVDRLKAGEFSQKDIDAVVLREEIADMRELESNAERVERMTVAYLMHQSWERAVNRIERLRAVTRDDVIRVANQYLTDRVVVLKRVSGPHQPPKVPKPNITPIAIDSTRESALARAIKAMPAAELEPQWLEAGQHYQRLVAGAGPVIAVQNTANQLFEVSYRFETGSRTQPLVCFALELLENSGTGELDPAALRKRWWAMGTDVDFSCGADELTISMAGIERNFDASLTLLKSWLREPVLAQDALAKLRANLISQRADAVQEPQVLARALGSYARLAQQSPFLQEPSNQALNRATIAQLRRLVTALPTYRHRTTYFGPRAAKQIASSAALGSGRKPLRARPPVRFRPVSAPQVFFLHKDIAQAQVSVFWPRPPVTDSQWPVVELFNEYVGGGMAGLVFQQIREARGLAYAAFASYLDGARPGDQSGLFAFVATQADKTGQAVTELLGLLRALPAQSERFSLTVQTLDRQYRSSRVAPRSITKLVSAWAERGLDADPRPRYWQTIARLDLPALSEFGAQFADGGFVIAVLGDRSRIDLEALAKLGQVVEVRAEQLFSY